MGSSEKWILAVLIIVGAFYLFGLKALYLFGVAALIYLIARPSQHRRI